MKESQSPRTWRSPDWHADFGDPALELEHLREFSLLLLAVLPNATVTLEIPEPGLMYVHIQLEDGTVAEVHSVPFLEIPEKRRLAIFFAPGTSTEEEIYAESIDSAVNHFSKRLNS